MSALNSTQSHSIRLYPLAEGLVQTMHLNPQKEHSVRNCVSRYSTPHTFCDFLNWIAFCVSEFYRGKQSQWQTTKRMIKDNAMELAIQQGVIQRNPQSSPEKIAKDHFSNSVDLFHKESLDLCLLAQNKRTPLSADWNEGLKLMDVNSLIQQARAGRIDAARARVFFRQL